MGSRPVLALLEILRGEGVDTPHHYTPGPALPPGMTVVQLDSDPDEIGRNFPVDAGLVGALAPSLDQLAELLRAWTWFRSPRPPERSWTTWS